MLALGQHRCPDRLATAADQPLLLLIRTGSQKVVQLLQVAHLRHRNKIVPAELAAFTLHAAFFVAFSGRTELRAKTPVRAESDEPRGLFPLTAAQNLLHCAAQVIEPESTKNASKPLERQLVRFQKRLLSGVRIGR